MRYGSLFSGIEAASLAWKPLGWQCAWVAEIDPFCRALLKHHYPDVPNLGDVTKVDWDAVEPVDVIVGGSPCQSFSIAGKRLGLDDPRGNLALVYLDVVRRVRPRWMVFENVPGLLSSDEGRDFGTFLGILGQLWYGFSWRILDAQHGGVPQRRRRLWVVGHSGGQWQRAAAVLLEQESLHGDPAPGRQAGKGTAARALCSTDGGIDREDRHTLIAFGGGNTAGPIEMATARSAHPNRQDFDSETFITHISAEDLAQPVTGRNGDPGMVAIPIKKSHGSSGAGATRNAIAGKPDDPMFTLDQASRHAIAFTSKDHGADAGDTAPMLRAMGHDGSHANGGGQVAVAMPTSGVRRLLPVETERLMAMPDGYTLVPYRGKPAADGPRYKAIGNSMVVSEIRWLGERIEAVMRCLEETDDPPASPPGT